QLPNLLMFEESHDPEDHLLRYNSQMLLHAPSDAIKCRMFPMTLGHGQLP
ncbi:hypothetical protein A2U01_0080268, partial [Trifolium medium]|nr:hypothetical protein [Trifolium medium]